MEKNILMNIKLGNLIKKRVRGPTTKNNLKNKIKTPQRGVTILIGMVEHLMNRIHLSLIKFLKKILKQGTDLNVEFVIKKLKS